MATRGAVRAASGPRRGPSPARPSASAGRGTAASLGGRRWGTERAASRRQARLASPPLLLLLLGVAVTSPGGAGAASVRPANGASGSAPGPAPGRAESAASHEQTREVCRGYYDVMGQYDPSFTCAVYPYIFCCGSCGFRYCCTEPGARLNQTQCVKNETPRLANGSTGPPDVERPFSPAHDKTHTAVYSVCGVVAFLLLSGIFTKVGLYKPAGGGGLLPAHPTAEPGGHCRLLDVSGQAESGLALPTDSGCPAAGFSSMMPPPASSSSASAMEPGFMHGARPGPDQPQLKTIFHSQPHLASESPPTYEAANQAEGTRNPTLPKRIDKSGLLDHFGKIHFSSESGPAPAPAPPSLPLRSGTPVKPATSSRQASEAGAKAGAKAGGRGEPDDEPGGAKGRMTKMHSHPGAWVSPARERAQRGDAECGSRSGSQALHHSHHHHHQPAPPPPPPHQHSQHSQHGQHHHTLQHHHTRGHQQQQQQQQQGAAGAGVRGQLSQQDTWPGPPRYHSTLDRVPTGASGGGSGRHHHHQHQQGTLRPAQTTLSKAEVTV